MNQERATRKKFHMILIVVMAIIIIVFDLVFIVMPDKETSETENRSLQLFPRLTWATLTDGRFETNFDSYVADQFPLRNSWLTVKTTVDRLSGKTESNGIFLGSDGYLIQDFTNPTDEKYEEILAEFTDFKSAHSDLDIYALIAPTAITILNDKLPLNAVTGDESGFMDRLKEDLESNGITFIDTRDALNEEKQVNQVYYRTDHHWTTFGAYAAYNVLAETLDLSGKALTYDSKLVTDSFSGTLTASSGFRMDETDEIYIFEPQAETDYSVFYVDESEKTASFYKTENLDIRDKYTVFFNGNHAEIKIETDAGGSDVLLVIKDSYANCFVPFLCQDYRKIIMVDPRYYTGDLDELITTEKVTKVLYLYNASSLSE